MTQNDQKGSNMTPLGTSPGGVKYDHIWVIWAKSNPQQEVTWEDSSKGVKYDPWEGPRGQIWPYWPYPKMTQNDPNMSEIYVNPNLNMTPPESGPISILAIWPNMTPFGSFWPFWPLWPYGEKGPKRLKRGHI